MRVLIKNRKFMKIARRALSLICSFYFLSHPLYPQPHYSETRSDSLISLLSTVSGKEKVDLLLEISQSRWFISFEESIDYATTAYQLAGELNYPEGKADALNRIGNVHYFLRNHSNVIENYTMALELADSLNDYRRMGVYLNNIGLLYRELQQYDSSAVYLLRALRAKEEYGDKELISSTLNNLGHLYRDEGRYSLALEYFVRQLDILEETREIRNLAIVHRQTGEVFHKQKRYNESVKHYKSSLSYAAEISDSFLMASAHNLIGKSLLDMDELGSAIEQINKSMYLAASIPSESMIRNNYNLLYHYHKKNGDPKTAYDYLVRYSSLKDSLRNQHMTDQIKQLEGIFETGKQNNRIELLQKENLIQNMQLNRQENMKILLIALVVTLLIFNLIIAYRFRTIQRTNRLLKQKMGELEKTNDKLRSSSLALEQLNATKNRFFSIIAHDLKNPFNALLGFSEMIASKFNELEEEEIREYISIVHQSSQNLYKLLENLLKWSAAQTGTMHYLPEQFDLISLIHSEISFYRMSAGRKKINISTELPDEIIVNSDKLLLSSVIRNLIDNAIKFTPKGGNIDITATNKNGEVIVEISDTGIGIPYDMQEKLFHIDGDICRKGTNNEDGGGLGLILCKELIEKAGGRISFESEPGKGSTFSFALPRKKYTA
jgi:signal transduction histidine kinase